MIRRLVCWGGWSARENDLLTAAMIGTCIDARGMALLGQASFLLPMSTSISLGRQ